MAWVVPATLPRFNLVYSDACHHPDGVLFECEQLLSNELLDLANFAIVWDDNMLPEACIALLEAAAGRALTVGNITLNGWTQG